MIPDAIEVQRAVQSKDGAKITLNTLVTMIVPANAPRRAGAAEDRELLNKMLCDAHWWVRYRAAQALISLPLASLDAWEETAAAHSDQYAGEMLRHAIAEQRLSQA